MAIAIRRRRDSTANWTANNPILEDGQLGFELTASGGYDKFKIGDGITPWNNLKYSYDWDAVKEQADIVTGAVGVVNSKQEALDLSVSNAGTAKTNLDGSISTANTTKTNLDSSIVAGGTVLTNLNNAIAAGDIDSLEEQINSFDAKVDAQMEYITSLGQVTPLFANTLEELQESGETNKFYVLPDGYIYGYIKTVTEGETVPNFTNLMDDSRAYIKTDMRYSLSGEGFQTKSGENAVVCYIPDSVDMSNGFDLRVKPYELGGYGAVYAGSDGNTFPISSVGNGNFEGSATVDSNGATLVNITISDSINRYIVFHSTTITDLVVTVNEEITYTTTEGGITYKWANTGHAFVPADYEGRIIANERCIDSLKTKVDNLGNQINSMPVNSGGTSAFSAPAYAPVPQLPADGTADFHGLNITTEQAYAYMDALANKYKGYVTKQTMGKDQSGTFDYNRYILCKSYWRAWLKPNYPMMFAWINGNTIIYSVSASPRVGDTMYTTPYIGTIYSTVTSVNSSTPNATNEIAGTPSTRTVNGLTFARYKTGDVEPTIVYTKVEKSISALNGGTVYNSSFSALTNVTAYTKEAITCADGIVYTRYPFEDLKADKSKPLSVFILTNEHGHKGDNKVPSITLMRMAKDLCENRENPFLQWLKENAMITMIPVGNPWGYDPSANNISEGAGYYNSRGININRNYDTPGWAGSDTNYGGTETFGAYPGSEIETQNIMNTMHLCKAKVGLSEHGMGLGQYNIQIKEYTDGLMWQGCGFDKNRMTKVAEVLFSDYGQLIGGHTTWDQSYEYCGKSPAYIQYVGAVGGLNEIPDFETGTLDLYTPTVMEAAYTQLLLFLQTWCEEAIENLKA